VTSPVVRTSEKVERNPAAGKVNVDASER
jgi:hypothetical protein